MLSSTALRYFHVVADVGSIAVAAERLNVAGSAVSRQIKLLEAQVMAELFERRPRGMKLTAAGENLAAYVRRSVLEQNDVIADIGSRRGELSGVISIAAAEGLTTSFIPRVATKFQALHPAIVIRSVALGHEDIIRNILYGQSDIGMSFETKPYRDIATLYRTSFDSKVFMRPGHPLSTRNAVGLREISAHPIATSPGTVTRQLIEHRAAVEGVNLDIRFESNNSTSIFNYLKSSQAVAFGIEISAQEWKLRRELVSVPLNNSGFFKRSIYINVLSGRALPQKIKTFTAFLHKHLQRADA